MGLIDMIIDMLKNLKYFLSRNARLERHIYNLTVEVKRQEDESRFWFNRTKEMYCPHCKGQMKLAKPNKLNEYEWNNKIKRMEGFEI